MAKKLYTHWGVVVGADARTSPDWSAKVRIRATKLWWVTPQGNKYSKRTGRGPGDWPLRHLKLNTIQELKEPCLI